MTRIVILLALAGAAFAEDDLKQEVDDLKRVVEKQSEEIARLKKSNVESEIDDYLDESQGYQSTTKPNAGYDGRFYVQSSDGQYRLQFLLYSQFRYNWNEREEPDAGDERSVQGFEVARTRLWFDGDLTEHFYFHFRININSSSEFKLVNAFVRWNAPDGWHVSIGERWFYLSREDWTLPKDQLTTEFSANDLIFAIGTSQGVMVDKTHERIRYYLGYSDGPFSGGQDFTAATTDFTLTARFDFMFFTDDWSVWDDLVGRRGRPFGLMVGVGLGYAKGKDSSQYDDVQYLTVDVNLNWDGGQLMVAPTFRWTDPEGGEQFYQWGIVVQGGHFVAEHHQLYARYELVSPGDMPGDAVDYNSVTVGYSYFPLIETNLYKFSVEFSYLFDPLSNTIVPADTGVGFLPASEGAQWYFRLQAQFGF